jgi:hypothetical protein
MAAALSSLFSYIFPPTPGQSEDHPLEIAAIPGLTTLLDVALFRSNEGQLTATICSSHALLACWLDVKYQSQLLLRSLVEQEDSCSSSKVVILCESFARQCLESAMDAIERLATEKFAQSANLSDPYDSTSSSTVATHHNHNHHYSYAHNQNHLLSGVGAQGIANGILESKEDTGRRTPTIQRRRDCWESPRLFCPDHVWADDAYAACQRWIRNLAKHSFLLKENTDSLVVPLSSTISSSGNNNAQHKGSDHDKNINNSNINNNQKKSLHLSWSSERQASLLVQLIQDDLPIRLYHFRQAMEAEAVVTKRLYLVKCEYRAPLRTFWEAHQSLLKAPPMALVDQYLLQKKSQRLSNNSNNNDVLSPSASTLKAKLQSLLQTPELIELLALEKECEQLELDMGQALFPFSEMARSLDHKKARLKAVPGVVKEQDLAGLQEAVRVCYMLCYVVVFMESISLFYDSLLLVACYNTRDLRALT